ncbi:MAG: hypothetical protein II870_03500, partial [Synergistaceae bacterium]|nr:hypothetical protein [Synergistaceae bacterium]
LKGDSLMKSVWKEMADRQFAAGYEQGGENALERVAISLLKAGDLDFEKIAKHFQMPLSKVKELAESLA